MSAKVVSSASPVTTIARRGPIQTNRIMVCGGIGILLYVAHVAFIPLALALLFALILSGPVEALHKKRVPRSVSAALILIIALSGICGVVDAAWIPTQEWFAKAPQTMTAIKQKVTPVAKFMSRLDDMRKNMGTIGTQGHPAAAAVAASTPAAESAPMLIVDMGGAAMAGILTFVIVTLFLLTGGPPMIARMTAAFADNLNSSYVLKVIERVREEVGRFYLTTTLINLGLGTATGLAMWAWGMPTPYLWGAMAALLNYIPYAGPGTTLLVVSLVALVSFTTLGHVFGVAGSYVVIALIEGQIAQPLLVGRRMEVNPLRIFLALWFGGLFWGIACTDETVSRARAALQNAGEVISCNARSAGAARTIGAAAALKHFSAIPTDQIWLANTDADTHVPPNWLQHQLRFADSGDLAVAGIVELEVINNEELLVHRMFRETYQVAPDGTHTHVHGANLGVRADAYLAVGGWGTIPLAEDHCLWDRLQRAGFRLRSTDLSRVTTSARLQGRAPAGLQTRCNGMWRMCSARVSVPTFVAITNRASFGVGRGAKKQ